MVGIPLMLKKTSTVSRNERDCQWIGEANFIKFGGFYFGVGGGVELG